MDNSVDKVDNQVDKWYDIEEAAQLLDVSTRTVRRRIKNGDIESSKRDGKWFVKVDTDQFASTQMSKDVLIEQLQSEIQHLRQQVISLQEALRQKDEQLAEASHRHDTVVMQMTRLLEYHQQPFWRKLFSRKALPPPEHIMDMEPGGDKAKE